MEFKLGGGRPEADAAQVCLYHELLGGSGSAALLHFGSDPMEERLFKREEIVEALPKLVDLIGALAGVSPNRQTRISIEASGGVAEWPRKPGDAEEEMGRKLKRALREYRAEAQLTGEPQVGPTFVRFLLEPQRGVTVGKIERRGAELQVRLGLDQEPIIRRVEGRIAVDVQRPNREYVSFSDLRGQLDAARFRWPNRKAARGHGSSGKAPLSRSSA